MTPEYWEMLRRKAAQNQPVMQATIPQGRPVYSAPTYYTNF